jgi:hypothetical protein
MVLHQACYCTVWSICLIWKFHNIDQLIAKFIDIARELDPY